MKTFRCAAQILLIILCSGKLYSQNWQLVNPDYHYHYIIYDNQGQHTDSLDAYTVRVDSIQGEIFYLNRWFPEFEPSNWEELPIYHPHFLQKEMIQDNDGATLFRNPGNLRIPPALQAGETWLFDIDAEIEAQVERVYEMEIYQTLDSVKLISLSSGDKIRVSKSFGILAFPKGYATGEFYQQIGISGPDLGFTFPRMEDFFSYAPGDQLEYLVAKYIGHLGNGANDKSESDLTRIQMRILDTLTIEGNLQYRIQHTSCHQNKITLSYDPNIVFSDESTFSQWERVDTFDITAFPQWSEEGDKPNLWDVYPHEVVLGAYSGAGTLPVSTVSYEKQSTCHPGLTRTIAYKHCLVGRSDSLMECEYFLTEWEGEISWIEGVGLVSEQARSEAYIYQPISTSRSLEASLIGGMSCADFSPLSQHSCESDSTGDPKDPSLPRVKELTFAFANPVNQEMLIAFPEVHAIASLSLIDISGRMVYEEQIQDQWEIRIPALTFGPGVYVLVLRDAQAQISEMRKVIIRP